VRFMDALPFHATLVEYHKQGIMIKGPSGAGKSDVALRLIERGAILVADDQLLISLQDKRLIGYAPERLKGLLEVRGIGIINLPCHPYFSIDFLIELVTGPTYERFPSSEVFRIYKKTIPKYYLWAFEASILEKIKILALTQGKTLSNGCISLAEES
jgi:HPr kinase/phosphorylase